MATQDFRPAFHELRQRIRGLYRRDGHARLAALAAGWFVAGLALDYFLHLPWALRAISLVGFAVAGVHLWRRYVAYPLSRIISDDDLALAFEEHHPELADRLISTVQLERQAGAFEHPDTANMAALLAEDARRQASQLDIERVLDARAINRRALAATGLVIVSVVLILSLFTLARIWFQRAVLLLNTPWPQRVYLEVLSPRDLGRPETVEFSVAQGSDVDVQVVATERGENPGVAWVHYQTSSMGSRWSRQGMASTSAQPRIYGFTFNNLREDVTFYVTAGDDRTATITMHTLVPPSVIAVRAALDYPEYTGLVDATQESGEIKAPAGTKVRITAETNMQVTAAELSISSSGAAPSTTPLAIATDGRSISGDLEITSSTTYTLSLTSHEGMINERAAIYQIIARPDQPPRVRATRPGRSIDATANGFVDFEGKASDDYGVREVVWRWWLGDGTASAAAPEKPATPADEAGPPATPAPATTSTTLATPSPAAREVEFRHHLELAEIKADQGRALIPGDRLVYVFAATEIGPAQEGRSPEYEITIVSAQHIERDVTARIKEIQERLQRMRSDSERLAAELRRLGEGDSVELSTAEVAALMPRQGRLVRETRWAAEQLADIAEIKERNRLANEEEMARIRGMRNLADSAATKNETAGKHVDAALATRERAESRTQVDAAAAASASAAEDLASLISALSEYEDFQSIVSYFLGMREQQQGLLEDLLEEIKNQTPAEERPR